MEQSVMRYYSLPLLKCMDQYVDKERKAALSIIKAPCFPLSRLVNTVKKIIAFFSVYPTCVRAKPSFSVYPLSLFIGQQRLSPHSLTVGQTICERPICFEKEVTTLIGYKTNVSRITVIDSMINWIRNNNKTHKRSSKEKQHSNLTLPPLMPEVRKVQEITNHNEHRFSLV